MTQAEDVRAGLLSDSPIDYAVFVIAAFSEHRAPPLHETEVGSAYTVERAKIIAHRYPSARVIEAWQWGGRYRYGRDVYLHGLLHGTRPPVEPFTGGFRRG